MRSSAVWGSSPPAGRAPSGSTSTRPYLFTKAGLVGDARQIDGWIGAASLTLTDDDLDVIATAIATTGAGSGPARP